MGSDGHFVEFVHARSAALLRLAVLLTGNREDGEDLLQTALVKAYRSWWRLRSPERLLAHDGFTVKVTREAGLEPLGRVIFQHPASGSLVRPGATVTLVVSAGPATRTASP